MGRPALDKFAPGEFVERIGTRSEKGAHQNKKAGILAGLLCCSRISYFMM